MDFYYTGAIESAFQVKGFIDAHGKTVRTQFREAYEKGGLFLFDELDASESHAIVALHAALDNGILDAPDGMIKKHKDFKFIAAANTWGHGATMQYIGRNALDGATMDRYAVIPVEYDTALEKQIVENRYGAEFMSWVDTIHKSRAVARQLEMQHIISTRAVINGAKLLKNGMGRDKAFTYTVLKGIEDVLLDQFLHAMKEKIRESKLPGMDDQLKELRATLEALQDTFNKYAVRMDDMTRMRKRLRNLSDKIDETEQNLPVLEEFEKRAEGLSDKAKPKVSKASDACPNANDDRQQAASAPVPPPNRSWPPKN